MTLVEKAFGSKPAASAGDAQVFSLFTIIQNIGGFPPGGLDTLPFLPVL